MWWARKKFIGAAALQWPVAGSYSSANLDGSFCTPKPPATSTFPFESSVAVAPTRECPRSPTVDQGGLARTAGAPRKSTNAKDASTRAASCVRPTTRRVHAILHPPSLIPAAKRRTRGQARLSGRGESSSLGDNAGQMALATRK